MKQLPPVPTFASASAPRPQEPLTSAWSARAWFNWAYARHTGGTFVFRIEDTDAARDSQESFDQIIESLQWLGLDWDEGHR